MPGPDIPEIKWGTFWDIRGVPHVAPVVDEYLMSGHILSMKCACSPELNKGKKVDVVVHNVIH